MCIEVKSHDTTTSDATTIGFINTLLGSPGSFFILVVRKITNETIDIDAEIRTTRLNGDQENAKKTIKELITNPGSIFQLQRNTDGYSFESIKTDWTSKKIVFVMDLSTIYTGDHKFNDLFIHFK